MKKHLVLLLSAVVATSALALVVAFGRPATPVRAAGGGCPAAFIVGEYMYTGSGFDRQASVAFGGEFFFNPDPAPAVLTGTINGWMTINDARTGLSRVTVTGTYVMTGTNCTGRVGLHTSAGAIYHFDIAPAQWINGPAQIVYMVETDSGRQVTITLSAA